MMRKTTVSLAFAAMLMAATGVMAQAAQPERREVGNLVFDGVPQIPAELRPQLQRYRNARSAGLQGFMADGSILISTRFGETGQLHRVAAPGADRRQLTFFTEPVAILANTDQVEAAKTFVSFVLSEDGQKLAAEQGYIPVNPKVASPEGMPALSEIKLMPLDADRAVAEDAEARARFTEIFGG